MSFFDWFTRKNRNNISFRTLEHNDYEKLTQFLNVARGLQGTDLALSISNVQHRMSHPDLDPSVNCMIGVRSEEIVACALVIPELPIKRTVIEIEILTGLQNSTVFYQLLDWATTRSSELDVDEANISITEPQGPNPSEEESKYHLLDFAKKKYSPIRVYWRMRWVGSIDKEFRIPEGYSVRSLMMGEEAKLATIQNSSFGGQWGFSPNTEPQIKHSLDTPGASHEDVLLLVKDEDIAGYCWTRREGREDSITGVIGMIGVAPQFRGKGLGRVTLLASMRKLLDEGSKRIELEVDSENTPARELYLSVGFQKVSGLTWFEHFFGFRGTTP